MRLGLHALGIGAGSQRAVIEAVARAAEQQASRRCGPVSMS